MKLIVTMTYAYDMLFKEFQFSSSSRRISLFIAATSFLWLFNESSPHNVSIDPQYKTCYTVICHRLHVDFALRTTLLVSRGKEGKKI